MRDDTIIEFSKSAPIQRQLESHDWWVIARHLLAVAWSAAFLFLTGPASYEAIASAVVTGACAGLIILGSLTATWGRLTFRHKSVELWGLSAAVFGWLAYIGLVLVQIVAIDPDFRRAGVLVLAVLTLTVPLERWLFLLTTVLQDAGVMRAPGVRIRRKSKR